MIKMELPQEKFECEIRLIDLYRYPTARDNVVTQFIQKMLGFIIESWEGYPCIEKLKVSIPSPCAGNLKTDSTETANQTSTNANDRKSHESSSQRAPDTLNHLEGAILPENLSEQKSENSVENFPGEENERIWITEAAGDVSRPIKDWRSYEEDQIARIQFKNGNIYKGRMSRHLMHGDGEFVWANGTSYKGSFQFGDITGRGVLVWPTQTWYKGEMYKGYRQGCGLLVVPKRLSFTGSWDYSNRHGPGLLYYDSDVQKYDYYDAEWKKGVCSGVGLRVYPSGARYNGHWKDGERNGFGIMTWTNGDVYEGYWQNGKMHGLGQYTWSSFVSDELVFPARNNYYGTWIEGFRHGIGILETVSGLIIECEWQKDLKHGYGEIICRNGFNLKGHPLFSNDHLLDPDVNNSHATITIESCPLKYKTSIEGKSEIKKIPTHLPSECIDLCYHVERYLQNKWTLETYKFDKKKEDKTREVRKFIEFEDKTVNGKLHSGNFLSNNVFEGYFEEKWLRNIILRNLPFLREVYCHYASILYKKISRSSPETILIRLFMWQFLRDCGLHMREKSLSEIDFLVKKNPLSVIEDHRNPFERLYFFQFLHYLLEVAWQMYGRFAERHPKTPGALASAVEKLILEDIQPNFGNFTGTVLKDYKNLSFMKDVYQLYQGMQPDVSARQFLVTILNWENNSHLKRMQKISNERNKKIDEEKMSMSKKCCNDEIYKESSLNLKEELEGTCNEYMNMAYLGSINRRLVMHCILKVCPRVKPSKSSINMSYKVTFLEFYEILLLCANKCFEIKQKHLRKQKGSELRLRKYEEAKHSLLKRGKHSRDISKTLKGLRKI